MQYTLHFRECRDSNRGREGKKGEPDRSEVGRESPRGMEPRSGPGPGTLVGLSVHFALDSVWKWRDLWSFAKASMQNSQITNLFQRPSGVRGQPMSDPTGTSRRSRTDTRN